MEENTFVSYTRAQKKQIRADRKRILHVVEHFDFIGVIDDSPVQLSDGYVISDIETNELFASFEFQNLSQKEISRLHIRLLLYKDLENVPYMKIPFTYSYRNLSLGIRRMPESGQTKKRKRKEPVNIRVTEYFGNTALIKLPESYFKRIKLELMAAEYSDGTVDKLGIIVSNNVQRVRDMGDDEIYAYSKLNIYSEAEQYYPASYVPQITEHAWLCCCGSKNLISNEICPRCGRDREWQVVNINESALTAEVNALKRTSDKQLFDRTQYKGYEKKTTEEEKAEKMREYEKVLQRVAEQERRKEHNKMMVIPKILIFFGAVLLIMYIFNNI